MPTVCHEQGASIQDLIDILPTDNIGFDDPKFFSSAQQPLMCTNGRTSQTPELPITIEAVVTIPGTYYIKVSVCDQEEKFYGSFVIEDDTGGLMVLETVVWLKFSRVMWFG